MEKVIREADETLSALEHEFSRFDSLQINDVPFEGSWTAANWLSTWFCRIRVFWR
jgi:hypothetical protein